jgi:long-chain acyl-CoA synthetase
MSAETTPQRLLRNSKEYANEPAISIPVNGGWETETWAEFTSYVMGISKSLIALGFQHSDKLSIYSYNRREWYGCYAAAQMTGGAGVGVYHTCSPEEVEWVVGNSDSKVVFVGNNPMDNGEPDKMPNHRLMKVLDRLDKVEHVVMMNGVGVFEKSKVMTWDDFIGKGNSVAESEVTERTNNLSVDDTASLIYTSGTTGNPKGVELTHDNWLFELDATDSIMEFQRGEKYVSWLPLAHVFGQLVDNHYWMKNALHMYVVDNPLNVVDFAKEIQPHLFIGVPRIYEKIYSNVKAALDAKPLLKVLLKVPGLSGVLKGKLKEKIGMANCRFAITGAAPINTDILRLFQSLGVPIFEGYGMTEDTAGATINYAGMNRIGTVGPAFPNTEIKIAEDGEVLIKGRHVMKGYYKNPQATAETIIDGWLYTGDVGEIDADGFVKITGRKKEIYVTSGGKNIAPLVVEETMKSISIISQCFLVGDGRKFCSALFTLDAGAIIRDKLGVDANEVPKDPFEQMAKLKELGHTFDDFTGSDEVRAEVQTRVDELNAQFSSPEQVKKFSILPRDLTIDDGELTPTLKIRRKQISENWSAEIEAMYAE